MTTSTTGFRPLAVLFAVTAMIASLLTVIQSPPAEASHLELVAMPESENECAAGGGNNTIEVPIEVREPLTEANVIADNDIFVDFDTVAETSPGGNLATADVDYVRTSGTVEIPAGSPEGLAEITLLCDGAPEDAEEFTVFFHNPRGASFDSRSDQRSIATILDGAPDVPQFIVTGPPNPVTEQDPSFPSPDVNAVFQVCLDDTSDGDSVTASTRDGTATSSDDYEETTETFAWIPGEESCKEFEVPLQHDNDAEPQEHFFVDLSTNAFTSGTIAKMTAAALINDDDIPSVSVGEAVASEGSPSLEVPFEIEVAVGEDVYVVWHSAEGSASDGVDYTGTGGEITTRIPAGSTEATHAITLHEDSALEDWHESFFAIIDCLNSTASTDCSDGRSEESTVATEGTTFGRQAIQDNEPKISIGNASAGEGETMTFDIELAEFREDQDISVDYETVDASATDGEDYEGTSGTLTWDEDDRDEGNRTKQVTVDTLQDGDSEGTETFSLVLSNAQFAGIDDSNPGEGTITDDDAFNVDAGPEKSGESAAQVSFTAEADCPNDCTYTWDFGDGTPDQTGVTVQHRFAETGAYTVSVTVEGSSGSSATDTTTATITDSGTVERSAGTNREGTAIDVSSDHWDQADTVLLATGYAHADALAAGPLAKKLDAPLLLTNPNGLPDAVEQELDRLNANKVIILGGVHVVPQAQADELAADGYEVQRIADVNRFGTAADIATEVGATSAREVTVALGQHADENRDDWPDALSAGSFASLAEPLPSLLTHSSTVPQETLDALAELDTDTIFLLGGNVAISDTVEQQLEAEGYTVRRVFGADRYATSVAAGEIVMDRYPAGQVNPVFATGQKFPDGLTAGALAGKVVGPVVLVPTDSLDNASSVRAFLREHANPFDVGTIVGGEAVVSNNVQTQARSDIDTF